MRCAAATAALLIACGPRAAPAPVPDYGPPPAPVDPIACPVERLERLAARVGAEATIATEPILDASRIDKVPCRPAETDDACVTRARSRPAPASYNIIGVTIGGDVTHVEFTYTLDGRRITETAPSMERMIARLMALKEAGHKVVVLRGESAADAGSRHAAITYRGVGGQERRVATLRIRTASAPSEGEPAGPAAAAADVQAAATQDRMEIRSMEVDADHLVVVVTCGPG